MSDNAPGDLDHNPMLKPWQRPTTNAVAGKGTIETPGEARNLVWQTRTGPPSEYEIRLADALVTCFEKGIEALPALVDALNQMEVNAPNGEPWTENHFCREMDRLGD